MPILLIAGDMLDKAFQEARLVAEDVTSSNASLVEWRAASKTKTGSSLWADSKAQLQIEVRAMVESEWLEYLAEKKRDLGGRAFQHSDAEPLIVHSALGYLGGTDELVAHLVETYRYEDLRLNPQYATLSAELSKSAKSEFDDFIRNSESMFCFMELKVEEETFRLTFELFSQTCPKTCENFMALVTGELNQSSKGTTLHYLDTPIHRIVKDAWIQGGDIVGGKGDAGESIWGGTFPDETFCVKHDRPGMLAMANQGPHSNQSQFYITMRELPAFDNKCVAFGRVICGHKALHKINSVSLTNQRPTNPIVISSCGAVLATVRA